MEHSKEEKNLTGKSFAQVDEVRMLHGLYIRRRIQDHTDVKRQIAIYIADKYVNDFDSVLLDAGSTAERIAEELFARRQFLSVLTNNMGAYAAYTRPESV